MRRKENLKGFFANAFGRLKKATKTQPSNMNRAIARDDVNEGQEMLKKTPDAVSKASSEMPMTSSEVISQPLKRGKSISKYWM